MMLETVAISTALRDVSANVLVPLLQILRVSVCVLLGELGKTVKLVRKHIIRMCTDVCCYAHSRLWSTCRSS